MLEQESVHVSLHAPSIPSSQHLQTSPRVPKILEYPAIASHTTINNHIYIMGHAKQCTWYSKNRNKLKVNGNKIIFYTFNILSARISR
jgi:hypothetical protein